MSALTKTVPPAPPPPRLVPAPSAPSIPRPFTQHPFPRARALRRPPPQDAYTLGAPELIFEVQARSPYRVHHPRPQPHTPRSSCGSSIPRPQGSSVSPTSSLTTVAAVAQPRPPTTPTTPPRSPVAPSEWRTTSTNTGKCACPPHPPPSQTPPRTSTRFLSRTFEFAERADTYTNSSGAARRTSTRAAARRTEMVLPHQTEVAAWARAKRTGASRTRGGPQPTAHGARAWSGEWYGGAQGRGMDEVVSRHSYLCIPPGCARHLVGHDLLMDGCMMTVGTKRFGVRGAGTLNKSTASFGISVWVMQYGISSMASGRGA
ncbi:hypothetical protein C8J57DRAFT_1659918 [Mycena rebaudengoi]|nr:hypothetical protein C8J57DRAFT_1659918 [Mycena rebaudengoi]